MSALTGIVIGLFCIRLGFSIGAFIIWLRGLLRLNPPMPAPQHLKYPDAIEAHCA